MKIKNTASSLILQKLYKNPNGADVTFVLKNKLTDGESKVPAHKAILSASSPVFDRMFFGGLKEGAEVRIADVSFEAFCEFLQFFYLDEFELTDINIVEVFRMIDKYDVKECLLACERNMIETATADVICTYYDLATIFSDSGQLTQRLDRIISNVTDQVLTSISFKNCSQLVLRKILELNVMNCSESVVFTGAIAWATEACRSKGSSVSPSYLKAELGECLPLIRFPIFTKEEFTQCLIKHPEILEPNVFFDLLHYIYDKRPLTCGRHFNNIPRMLSVSFRSKHPIVTHQNVFTQSTLSFTVGQSIWVYCCDIVILGNLEGDVHSFLNGQTQPVKVYPLNWRNSSSPESCRFYRVKFDKPVLCTANVINKLCLQLDVSLDSCVQPTETSVFQTDGVAFNFNNENFFVNEMYFKVIF